MTSWCTAPTNAERQPPAFASFCGRATKARHPFFVTVYNMTINLARTIRHAGGYCSLHHPGDALLVFLRHPGRTYSRDWCFRAARGLRLLTGGSRTVDVHASRARERAPAGAAPATVRGVGYRGARQPPRKPPGFPTPRRRPLAGGCSLRYTRVQLID